MCRVVPDSVREGPRPFLELTRVREAAILAAAIATVLIARNYSRTYYGNVVDDAATSMQYAKNLALGNGIVFNPGERVEGYTNFLWVVLQAPLFLFARATGSDFVPLLVHFNLFILWACVVLIGLLSLRLAGGLLVPALIAVALALADNSFACWAVFGLETHLLALCFLLALWFASRPHRLRWLAVGAALAAAHLTRPDAGLFCAVLLGSECVEVARARFSRGSSAAEFRSRAWDTARIAMVWLGVYGVYFAWRYHYYGYPFPNTYYLKLGGPIDAWARGIEYVKGFFEERWYIPTLALTAVLGVRERTARTLVVYLALHTLYVTYVGGDFFSGHRFFVPEIPLFAVAIAIGLGRITAILGRYEEGLGRIGVSPAWIAGAGTAVFALGLVLVWQRGRQEGPLKREILAWRDDLRDNRKLMAWLKAKAPPGASVATCLIGHTGFFSDLRVIDLCGVIDPVVAHRTVQGFGSGKAGHEKTATLEETLRKRPTYIVDGYLSGELWSRGYYLSGAHPTGVDDIWALDTLAAGYERVPSARIGFDAIQGWHAEGDAFAESPAYGNRPGQGNLRGRVGACLNSFHPSRNDGATGSIRSPAFSIVGDRLTLRVAGGKDHERLRVSLLVDGERAFSETGRVSDTFTRREWNTEKLRGKQAVLEVVDQATDKWGYIAVDELEQWLPKQAAE